MRRYEGMFLFDNTTTHQWSEMEAEVRRLCDRIQADLQVCVKFDERKLAYEIKGRKRGTYVLTYFSADPARITDLERDAELSEVILRLLVLRAEHLSEERLAELRALPPEQPLQPISSDGRRGEGGWPKGRPEPPPKAETTQREPEAKVEAPKEAAKEAVKEAASEEVVKAAAEGETEGEPESSPQTTTEEPPAAETPESKPADE